MQCHFYLFATDPVPVGSVSGLPGYCEIADHLLSTGCWSLPSSAPKGETVFFMKMCFCFLELSPNKSLSLLLPHSYQNGRVYPLSNNFNFKKNKKKSTFCIRKADSLTGYRSDIFNLSICRRGLLSPWTCAPTPCAAEQGGGGETFPAAVACGRLGAASGLQCVPPRLGMVSGCSARLEAGSLCWLLCPSLPVHLGLFLELMSVSQPGCEHTVSPVRFWSVFLHRRKFSMQCWSPASRSSHTQSWRGCAQGAFCRLPGCRLRSCWVFPSFLLVPLQCWSYRSRKMPRDYQIILQYLNSPERLLRFKVYKVI